MDTTKITLKGRMVVERLLGRRVKAHIGQACGVGKNESEAKARAEEMAVDILTHMESARIEIRDGYLIVSQVESSESGWYTIKHLAELTENQVVYSCCCMRPSNMRQAINDHLAQYKADEIVTRDPDSDGEED